MSNRIYYAIIVVAAAVAITLFALSIERYEEEKNLGWSRLALQNPYLAAVRLAEKAGMVVDTFDSYLTPKEMESFGTLFIPDSGHLISSRRADELVDWVDAGGHLIVGAQNPSASNVDWVLNYFGISASYGESEDDGTRFESEKAGSGSALSGDDSDLGSQTEENEPPFSERLEKHNQQIRSGEREQRQKSLSVRERILEFERHVPHSRMTSLEFKGVDGELLVIFPSHVVVDHPAISDPSFSEVAEYEVIYAGGDQFGTRFIQVDIGAGLVTVLANPGIFGSNYIGYFDNAFLWETLAFNGERLGMLHGSKMPSLGQLMWKFMPETVMSFLVLLMLWLWRQLPRFGATHRLHYQTRRSILEHITAAAQYRWRGGWQAELLEPLQQEIQKRAERQIPAYSAAEPSEKRRILASAASISPESLAAAMQAGKGLSEEKFLQTVKVLQRIKDSI
ncbi:DUF4350 domain-containing protein [Teredinibacter turnerae]|uniref:DUF4350 domain-containing protein n=1 Tax=Teredinibacter turnerae TaxID=2426 RepID=UPI0004040CB6|nr:DUF4350 domain-containing protein [Teredinibacter turnerae]